MAIDLLCVSLLILFLLLLTQMYAWTYIVMLLLVEAAWVGLCYLYARLALSFNDLGLMFTAMLILLLSAVELVLGLVLFVYHFHLTHTTTHAQPKQLS
jgi:hypothetical protein